MKKQLISAFAKAFTLITACVIITSCGATKSAQTSHVSNDPFDNIKEISVGEIDTDEYFGATGIAYGAMTSMGQLQQDALSNGQDIIRQKMKHAYKGLITSYANTVRDNINTDMQSKVERGGYQIIDAIVNDTRATKNPNYTPADEKGNIYVFIPLRVYKKEVADKIADMISEDEELKIRFKEDEFRKRIDDAFKKYKEEQK